MNQEVLKRKATHTIPFCLSNKYPIWETIGLIYYKRHSGMVWVALPTKLRALCLDKEEALCGDSRGN